MLPETNFESEEALAGLQRMWNLARARSAGATCLVAEVPDTLETFEPAEESDDLVAGKQHQLDQPPPDQDCSDADDSDVENLFRDHRRDSCKEPPARSGTAPGRASARRCRRPVERTLELDARTLGDAPALYRIAPLRPHQMPVLGVYVDARVAAGFRYKVRPLESSKYLFQGKALTLNSIGRGYAKRFTFESSSRINNDNYFWSDSRPEGFSFEIEAVSDGDKFTIFDSNNEAQGTMEVIQIQKEQLELEQCALEDKSLEKKIQIHALCKTEWYESGDGEATVLPVSGVAVLRKKRGEASAELVRVANVTVGGKSAKKGYELRPGVQSSLRRTTVCGEAVGDAPTKYTIVGLEHYELPVIGTFVDPRIVAGFHYRVRAAGKKRYFFQGRSMLLQSIGVGYGKRITFAPDTLNDPENYFWSDSHPSGLGFEPRAVHAGMRFEIIANGEHLGDASVFRADLPQIEEKTELVECGLVDSRRRPAKAVDKHIHVDVTCHVVLATTGGGSCDSEVHLMRVSGTALVRKAPNEAEARLLRVYNVGLDSQLNQLFVRSQTELTFHPLP